MSKERIDTENIFDLIPLLGERLMQLEKEEVLNGHLYIIPTPLGNLGDMTLRSLVYLSQMDIIFCEDTRNTKQLLNAYGLTCQLQSAHEHNFEYAAQKIIENLTAGKKVALCSDAGLPVISDPGSLVVHLCRQQNIPLHVLPGPSAGITAYVGSGIMSRHFLFVGFLPRQAKKREKMLKDLLYEQASLIIYESPHRLKDCIKSLCKMGYGTRKICLARELTKKYEEWLYKTVNELYTYLLTTDLKGEFVLTLEGFSQTSETEPEALAKQAYQAYQANLANQVEQFAYQAELSELAEQSNLAPNLQVIKQQTPAGDFSLEEIIFQTFLKYYNIDHSMKNAAKLTANDLALKKNEVYQRALSWKNEGRIYEKK